MLKKRYFSANSVISAITTLIITMMALIACLMVYFLRVLDDNAMKDVHTRVNIALSIEKEHLHKLTIDYSYWGDAYTNVLAVPNPQWIEDNYQDYLLPSYNLTYIATITSEKQVQLHAQREGLELNPQDIYSSAILERLRGSEPASPAYQAKAFFSEADGQVFLVGVEPYRRENDGVVVDGAHLVLAQAIDDTYLAVLAERFRLPKLSLVAAGEYDDSMSLEGFLPASNIATIYWSSPHIMNRVAPYMIVILLAFLIITVVLARLLLNKDFRHRAQYQEELFEAATTDPLTNVANRRYFMTLGKKEFQLQLLQKHSLCLIVFDLDHFKLINDTHGHAVGDLALQHFAKICQDNIRATDLFARLGGEEFAAILPKVDQDKAIELANNIRLAISDAPLMVKEKSISLTVSIGLACLNQEKSLQALLDHADKALYLAKNSGRNVVKVYQ